MRDDESGRFYQLNGRLPEPCTFKEFSLFLALDRRRIVGRYTNEPWSVITSFTGIDVRSGRRIGDAKVFETLVLDTNKHLIGRYLYSTWDQALEGHESAASRIQLLVEMSGAYADKIIETFKNEWHWG